ncbi:caspase family protein [Mesorhizobium sp. KR1-2]|uniref:caspase family protein n=1 Tax=Mesorhizobium sp. KR1-2 TaxID=3156609 RepID=UPI0032B4835B
MRLLPDVAEFFKSLVLAAVLAASVTGNALSAPGPDAGKRVALVIGNSVYKALPSLPNPANDVREVGATLRAAGFDVTIGVDVDRLALEETVRRFLRSSQDAEAGLIYYSGHGIQVGGHNFLVPVDATLETPYDVETQTMPLDLIFNHLRQTSRVQLIFLDACRNNPFNAQKYWIAETLQPVGATRGLARIDSNLGSLIAFSTEPGQVALDGTGSLSPYTQSFVKHVNEPAKEIRQILTEVRRDVIAATDGKQVPWENSSLTDSFYFRPAPPAPVVEPMQQVSVQAGATAVGLHIIPPRDETGSDLAVTINQVPQVGILRLDGKPLEQGAKINGGSLARLSYDVTGVASGTIGLIGYTVTDAFGQTAQGVVAIAVMEDTGAKLAEEKRRQEEQRAAAADYLGSLSRDVSATVGVGPVPGGLPAAPEAAERLAVKVMALPEKGILRAGDRVIGQGHILDAADIPLLSYEPQVGSDGASYSLTLAAASDDIEPATIVLKPKLDPCDFAAAAPLDLQGVTAGKLPNEIDPAVALPACTEATKTYPAVARFVYQLGRTELADRQPKKAFETIRKAMDAGHVRASEHLASLYMLGVTGQRDPARATATARLGADKGDPYALYSFGKNLYYGYGTEADPQKGLQLMLQAADLGHTYAMNELGHIFLNGIKIAADPERAIRFYEAGVERNDIYSMNNLALAYRNGKGVPADLDKAVELFTRAAEGGQPYAPTNLGRMYRDGVGVTKDLAVAAKWLEMGAERGDYWGAFDRAHLALSDDTGEPDFVTAARFLALASAVNRPGTGDADNRAQKELAKLPAQAKKKAEEALSDELSPTEKKTLPKAISADERLIRLAKAGWIKRNPRYDLF